MSKLPPDAYLVAWEEEDWDHQWIIYTYASTSHHACEYHVEKRIAEMRNIKNVKVYSLYREEIVRYNDGQKE